jgi:hypothetical protein
MITMTTQEKIMTTKEIANRLAELSRQGKFEQAQDELYADNAESIEPESAAQQGMAVKTKGLDSIRKKGEEWQNMVERIHGLSVSEPIIAGNFFAVAARMDITMKGHPRNASEEMCVYEVQDGKIVHEQFFY